MVLQRRGLVTVAALSTLAVAGMALTGCSGAGGGGGGGDSKSINVLMINNGTETDLSKLTAKYFTSKTGITVHFTLMPENNLEDKVNQELASQAGQYDVVSTSSYNIPTYAKNGWISPLNEYVDDDSSYEQSDILPVVQKLMTGPDGKVYGEPTETDTSLLMYNKKDLEKAGATLPEHPTWDQVIAVAKKLKQSDPAVAPLCLRGQAGWSMTGASLTTVVNTFGGTWFTKDWKAEVNAPEFQKATEFYVNAIKDYGPPGGATNGVLECFNSFVAGKSAMVYDSSNIGSFVEADGSPMKGNVGYVAAPTAQPNGKASGWLFTWALSIEKASRNQDSAAKFIKWASSKDFEKLVAQQDGWAAAPPGQRTSLYQNADYLKAAGAFVPQTLWAFENLNPADPGAQPRPTVGIQYVAIPEFAQLGTQVTQEISSAIAGKQTVKQALDKGQALAEAVAKKYQDK